MFKVDWRKRRVASVVVPLTVLSLLAALPMSVNAVAAGGTAKPPVKGAIAPFVTATLPDPVTSVDPALIHGFADTGFIQAATVDATNANCPNTPANQPSRFGGTLTLNNGPIVIPCNMVIQLPANTMTWADFVNGPAAPAPSLGSLALGAGYPSFQMQAIGNIVGDRRIAGLLYTSQMATNNSTGVITGIDYKTGNLLVDTGDPATPAIVQINDPNGRFGRAQTPDARFSVDDANPTIHAGTGYPMCVPRTDPAVTDDALCPQANRPNLVPVTVNGAVQPPVAGGCLNFSVAGIAPPVSGELTRPALDQAYCTEFVMKAPLTRAATDPDPSQQAPFEVGDAITFSGTLIPAVLDTIGAVVTPAYTSAHTIEANVGIYTFPGTQPSYLAIGQFGVGTADPNPISINGFAVETQDRIFLEAETTDVKTPVDIYMMDVNPVTGAVRNRWATPFEMTGEQNGPLQADNFTPIGGGITTQNSGPQPQRARLRATKAPVGLLSQPTRTLRIAVRSLCTPQAPVNDAAGNPVLTALDTCLNKNDATNQVANGLEAGQYFAPTFDFVFPENVKPGDLPVPYDFWHLPFLRYGEGATTQSAIGPSVGPLEPTPWSGEAATVPGAPTIGVATATSVAATVSWTPPASDGGSAITGYTVTALDSAGNPAGTVTVAGNLSSGTITGLTSGQTYGLQVAASNLLGTGPASGLATVVILAKATPGAPTIGLATAGNASANVGWIPPTSDGGSAITGYTIIAVDGAGVTTTATAAASATSATVTGLANGQSYLLQVQASNAIGTGPLSAQSTPVTPMTVPSAPTIGTATRGNASAVVTWAAPASDGGSAVTGYMVQVVDATTHAQVGALQPASAGATSLTVTGLLNGTTVSLQVQAINAAGSGPLSGQSNPVTPATVPDAPTIGFAAAGSTSAIVTWTPPASDGGSAIIGYTLIAVDASGNTAATATTAATGNAAIVLGLASGRSYQFQVFATNAVGAGALSAPSTAVTLAPPVPPAPAPPVTLATTPGAPLIGIATRGNASALVRWTAPANGGSAITGFFVRVVNTANAQVGVLRPAAAGATSLTVTGLVNGVAVRFQVQARNAVGTGALSALSTTVIPATVPSAPRIGTASSGAAGGRITALARWATPLSNGGSTITGYVVTALRMNANGTVGRQTTSAVQAPTARSLAMTLVPGKYRFVVRARNAVGLSALSARSNLVAAR